MTNKLSLTEITYVFSTSLMVCTKNYFLVEPVSIFNVWSCCLLLMLFMHNISNYILALLHYRYFVQNMLTQLDLLQDDISSTVSQFTSSPTSTRADDYSSITPPEAWGGDRLADKFSHLRHSINMPSRFASLTSTSSSSALMLSGLQQDSVPTNQSTSSLASGLSLPILRTRENPNQETLSGPSEAVSSPLSTKIITGQANLDNLGPSLSLPRRFSSYAERISAAPSFGDALSFQAGSPKSKKTGAETREELLNSLLSRSEMPSTTGTGILTTANVRNIQFLHSV